MGSEVFKKILKE